jgi:hypothetical protein
MKGIGPMILVVALSGVGVLYVKQHTWSLDLAGRIERLERERERLVQQLDSIEVDIVRLGSFARLESLWVAQGMPPRPALPVPVEPAGAVAVKTGSGSGI